MRRSGSARASTSAASAGPTGRGHAGRSPEISGPDHSLNRRDRRRIWGRSPVRGVDQSSITRLLDDQNRLKAALVRQARLLKVDVSEVRSTEAERLRATNEALLHGSQDLGIVNPFKTRELTEAQKVSEWMIAQSGKRFSSKVPEKPRPDWSPAKSRRPKAIRTEVRNEPQYVAHTDILCLRGPLVACFARARKRGYAGPPQRWLRGEQAERALQVLLRKGFTFPVTGSRGLFVPGSPMYYLANSRVDIISDRRHGFHGERLYRDPTNVVVLRRQSAAVPRLRLSDWPCGPHGRRWPSYPTLGESWEMLMRGKDPYRHGPLQPSQVLRPLKIPTSRIKPGMSVRTVSKMVIGIRASIEVPRKFLCHFRYRWGFLILHRRSPLPLELAKWLANQWKKAQFSLWLKCDTRYNEALRRAPGATLYVTSGFRPGGLAQWGGPRVRPCKRTRIGRNERVEQRAKFFHARSGLSQWLSSVPPALSDKSGSGVRLY
jgi:hypothetical protein